MPNPLVGLLLLLLPPPVGGVRGRPRLSLAAAAAPRSLAGAPAAGGMHVAGRRVVVTPPTTSPCRRLEQGVRGHRRRPCPRGPRLSPLWWRPPSPGRDTRKRPSLVCPSAKRSAGRERGEPTSLFLFSSVVGREGRGVLLPAWCGQAGSRLSLGDACSFPSRLPQSLWRRRLGGSSDHIHIHFNPLLVREAQVATLYLVLPSWPPPFSHTRSLGCSHLVHSHSRGLSCSTAQPPAATPSTGRTPPGVLAAAALHRRTALGLAGACSASWCGSSGGQRAEQGGPTTTTVLL